MTFIRTKADTFLNLANVRHAEILDDKYMLLHEDTGARHKVRREDWFQSPGIDPRTAFPAAPGTYMIQALRGDATINVHREPIIGWSIAGSQNVCMVTASQIVEWDEKFAVLLPDGQVQDMFTYFEDYDDWLDDRGRALLGSELWETISRKSGRSPLRLRLQQILRHCVNCLSKFK